MADIIVRQSLMGGAMKRKREFLCCHSHVAFHSRGRVVRPQPPQVGAVLALSFDTRQIHFAMFGLSNKLRPQTVFDRG